MLDEADCIRALQHYAAALVANTAGDDWDMRYFAAQTYIDLYVRTQEKAHLQTAYDLLLSNVNHLVRTQLDMNEAYAAKVQTVTVPDGATKQEKADIQVYNKLLEERRKTELPPVYEPLLLSCQLLMTVADELKADDAVRSRADAILHPDGAPLYLVQALDDVFYLSRRETAAAASCQSNASRRYVTFPSRLITEHGLVRGTLARGESVTVFDDYALTFTNRMDENALYATATYSSKAADSFAYKAGDVLTVEVIPHTAVNAQSTLFRFEVTEVKTLGFIPELFFVQIMPEDAPSPISH